MRFANDRFSRWISSSSFCSGGFGSLAGFTRPSMSGVNYFSRSATIILPYDDNYQLGLTALVAYTGADRGRG